MNGYINGGVNIFCGDYPPGNLNLLWLKRIIVESKDYYELMIYDKHISKWISLINQSLPIENNSLILSEDGFITTTEDNYQITLE